MAAADDPASDGSDLIAVGKVGPARGVHGDVFVEPWTDTPRERFAVGARLITEPVDAGPLTVESMSLAGGKLVVHFADRADRTAAEALRGVRLFVPRAQRPAIDDPDEFYDTDLIGLTARDPDGAELGPVRDVQHAGGASYLVVEVNGAQRLVPFVRAIVPAVDLAAGAVTVDAPPGLLEL